METAQEIIANLKAEQKGRKYPSKVKMLEVIWQFEGLASVSSFEIMPIIKVWYDRIIKENKVSPEFLKEVYDIDEI